MSDGNCTSCGAGIEYSAGVQSLKCPYCGAVNDIKRPENGLPSVIDKIIPLAITIEELEKKAYSYMANGDYTPDDMLEAAVFTKKEQVYVPAYIFRVEYDATWTASFGYDRTEQYTEYRTVYRDNRSYKEPVTRTKTVTDWRPQNGSDTGILSLAIYAGKSLKTSTLNPDDLVPYAAANGSPTEFNSSFLKGVDVEELSIPEVAAYAALKEDINSQIDDGVKRHAQGDRQKDWHWKATMHHQSTTLYVPICHIAFDYKGVEYHLWIDGVDGGGIRADKMPEDDDRKKQVHQGFIPLMVGGAAFVISSMVWSFVGAGLVGLAVAGGYGLLRRNALIGHSQKIRSSMLTQMHASSSSKVLSEEEQDEISKAYQIPEKSFFAKTHHDKKILPALSLAAIVATALPAYDASKQSMDQFVSTEPSVGDGQMGAADAPAADEPKSSESVVQDEQIVSQDQPADAEGEVSDASEGADAEVAGATHWSPSFDCAQASTSAENMICASQVLSGLDVRMAEAYKAASGIKDIRSTQVSWRKGVRDACEDESCMVSAYENRLQVLDAAVNQKASDSTPTPVQAGSGANSAAIDKMLQRAESALSNSNFEVAVSTSRNILLFDPSNQRAKEIMDIASKSTGPRW